MTLDEPDLVLGLSFGKTTWTGSWVGDFVLWWCLLLVTRCLLPCPHHYHVHGSDIRHVWSLDSRLTLEPGVVQRRPPFRSHRESAAFPAPHLRLQGPWEHNSQNAGFSGTSDSEHVASKTSPSLDPVQHDGPVTRPSATLGGEFSDIE
ncbi:hypothetical protein EDB81DRAFT_252316 [Dactylonectria macrodidyma]|uniref:Uncharacterized protein n=1 Tax=Dactylonectria macrodidyma TaxID=307937 RepID=A0A9P9JFM8_9HYPO|nr:hypothetical protein EDB81DRAFT_252316 [Dactylonectria macrodidyma]